MAGKTVNKSELAAITGVTTKTITVWQAEGMPYVEAAEVGTDNTYNTAAVIRWWIQRETKGGFDLDEERAKQAREQTETARLRNEAMRGEMVPLADAIDLAQRAAYALRQKIVTCSMTDEEKQAALTDIHSLANEDFRNFKRLDEADDELTTDGKGQKPSGD